METEALLPGNEATVSSSSGTISGGGKAVGSGAVPPATSLAPDPDHNDFMPNRYTSLQSMLFSSFLSSFSHILPPHSIMHLFYFFFSGKDIESGGGDSESEYETDSDAEEVHFSLLSLAYICATPPTQPIVLFAT